MSAALSAERETKYQRCATAPMEAQRDSRSISVALQRRWKHKETRTVPALRYSAERKPKYQRCATALRGNRSTSAALQR